jgi:hypothetical protein
MSSLVITAATLDDEYNNNNNSNNSNSNNSNSNNSNNSNSNSNNNNSNLSCKKNQTYKNKNSQKIDKAMLQQLYNSNNDDNYEMGDFVPVQQTMQNANIQQQVLNTNTHYNPLLDDDEAVDKSKLEMSKDNDIYKQFINNYNNSTAKELYNPNYSNQLNSSCSNNDLIKRLDKILYLLEEEKNDQNHLITEELILYVFLGVFIIYVLDSFVKAGKYVR